MIASSLVQSWMFDWPRYQHTLKYAWRHLGIERRNEEEDKNKRMCSSTIDE
jgi:hypothetical protein